MQQYLLSVIAAAMLVCVLTSVTQEKGAVSGVLRLLGGVFLLVVLIRPACRFDLRDIGDFFRDIAPEAEQASGRGEEMARNRIREIIISETETYILDIGRLQGVDLRAEVSVSDEEIPVPVSVTIYARCTEKTKTTLQNILEKDLNIPKECQKWIGSS